MLDGSLNFLVRGANPIPDGKGTIKKDHEGAKEVREEVPGRKAHGDAPDPAEGQYSGNGEAQGLGCGQHRGDDDGHAQKLAHGGGRGGIDGSVLSLSGEQPRLHLLHKAHTPKGYEGDHRERAQRIHQLEKLHLGLGPSSFRSLTEPQDRN